MRTLETILLSATMLAAAVLAADDKSVNVQTMPPSVIRTVPQAGDTAVDPALKEIRVTFSKDMMDQSWTWSTAWKDTDATIIAKPHYDANHRTCILKVKLEPNKTYGYWLNSQKFHGFQDAQGHSAVPYLLVFQTRGN